MRINENGFEMKKKVLEAFKPIDFEVFWKSIPENTFYNVAKITSFENAAFGCEFATEGKFESKYIQKYEG